MSFHRRRSALAMYEAHAGPNMTPMVDVVMVILIFFMTSAAILGPEWFLKTNLPRATVAAPVNDALLVRVRLELIMDAGAAKVRVDNADPVSVELARAAMERALLRSADALTQAGRPSDASARAANVAILVQAADDVPYEQVVRIHEMARALEIEKIGLVE